MLCPVHKREFGYTCAICEEELSYVGRWNLLEFFRQGVLGVPPFYKYKGEELAAYNHGRKYKETPK